MCLAAPSSGEQSRERHPCAQAGGLPCRSSSWPHAAHPPQGKHSVRFASARGRGLKTICVSVLITSKGKVLCWLLLWDLGCSAYTPGGLCSSFAVGRAARLFLPNYDCCDCRGPNSVLALDHLSQPNPWTKESSTSWGENREGVNHLWACGRDPWAVMHIPWRA